MLCCAMLQGYTELLDLLLAHRKAHGTNLPVDAYGSGEDSDDIKERAERYGLKVCFLGARDHLDESIHPYRCNSCYCTVVLANSCLFWLVAVTLWCVGGGQPVNVGQLLDFLDMCLAAWVARQGGDN